MRRALDAAGPRLDPNTIWRALDAAELGTRGPEDMPERRQNAR